MIWGRVSSTYLANWKNIIHFLHLSTWNLPSEAIGDDGGNIFILVTKDNENAVEACKLRVLKALSDPETGQGCFLKGEGAGRGQS